MSIFIDKHELAERKDIINPNLFAISELQYKYINQWDGSLADSAEDISIFPIAVNTKSFFVFTAIDSPYVPNVVNKVCYYNSDKKLILWTELKSGINLINHEASYMGVSINVKIQGAVSGHQKDWILNNRYKLEFGTVATPWCPAVEDLVLKSDVNNNFYYSMVPDNAQNHNNIFRGKNLGALNSTHIANIQNGSFKGMFIGDYFSINNSNYVIAGINYKKGHGDNSSLGNHLVLMPQDWSKTPTQTLSPDGKTTHYMNDTDTTAGGFAGSKLYQTYLPQIKTKLESDFGAHLMSFRTIVSTHVDGSGAPDQGEWRDAKVSIPNEVMIYGTTLNGNSKNSSWYNIGDEHSQLPLMRLNDAERNFNRIGAIWLRDIHSASEFAAANYDGHADGYGASDAWEGVRAFFLIG